MKLTPWYLVAIAPIAVAGCSGAFLGQCAVLAVTICIFVGTLSLGKHTAPRAIDASPPAELHKGA
jgi:hypothetical protein